MKTQASLPGNGAAGGCGPVPPVAHAAAATAASTTARRAAWPTALLNIDASCARTSAGAPCVVDSSKRCKRRRRILLSGRRRRIRAGGARGAGAGYYGAWSVRGRRGVLPRCRIRSRRRATVLRHGVGSESTLVGLLRHADDADTAVDRIARVFLVEQYR